jgi:hypothetical protein
MSKYVFSLAVPRDVAQQKINNLYDTICSLFIGAVTRELYACQMKKFSSFPNIYKRNIKNAKK